MREKHVLSSTIRSREAFTAIADHVEPEDFSEQGRIVWAGIVDYYDADPSCTHVDPEILGDTIARAIPADKHKTIFRNLVATLGEHDSSPANVVRDYLDTKRELVAHQLAAALLAGEDTARLRSIYDDLSDRNAFDVEESEERCGLDVTALVQSSFDVGNLISVSPAALNMALDGGVKPGHHLIVFARPEMGKTMLVIEQMAGFASQGLKVLYIGNEDPIDDINMRLINRLSGMTKVEVLNNPLMADERARENGYDNIILYSASPGTSREITGLIEKHEPHVLVLDQLRNLDMKQDNFVLKLEQAATQARNWAKKYSCVVVSVTQAGDSAAGKAVLDLGDVDFSNTGIPAQADVMIALGANDEHHRNGERVISLPKNKISGRHDYFAVQVQPHLSKVESF